MRCQILVNQGVLPFKGDLEGKLMGTGRTTGAASGAPEELIGRWNFSLLLAL